MKASTKESTHTSWVWNHGERIPSTGPGLYHRWRCTLCKQSFSAQSTSNAIAHLKEHGIASTGPIPTDQKTINQCKPMIEKEKLRKLIVEWIVDRRHAFNEVGSESFRRLIEYIDAAAISKILRSANTIRQDTIKYFEEAKSTIVEVIRKSKSLIHLSFDIWTSPNYKHMIAITAHWTDQEYKIRNMLIAIREVHGEHTGYNISRPVYEVVKEFDIVERLGYFMLDGAGNNNTKQSCEEVIVWKENKAVRGKFG